MEAVEAGLRRVVVETAVGPVVARCGDPVDGAVVILLHGAAGSWRDWLPLLRLAAASGRPVGNAVAIDLPGWGESPAPSSALDADLAAAIVAEVARAAGGTRWTVAGHSLGGFVALGLAARESEATDGVLVVSPTGPAVLDAIRRPVRGGLRLPWFAGMLLAMRALRLLPRRGAPVLRVLGRSGALGRLASPLFADPRHADPATLAAFTDAVRPEAFTAAARAAGSADFAAWRSIRCRVIGLRGARDVFVGRGDDAAFRRLVPRFSAEVVPGSGHFALVERPDAVLEALDRLRG